MHTVKEQVEYLSEFVTDYKNDLFRRLIAERTSYVTMVLEDFYQQHNCSAVLRSCDCFGIQNVHVIENTNTFKDNSEISMGAADWLTVHRHRKRENNTEETIDMLKSQGYRIVATTRMNGILLLMISTSTRKNGAFMGTELTGLSDDVLSRADEFVKAPMYGFTESYNVSVCAALLMYSVVQRLRQTDINWHLSEEERYQVLFAWYKRSVKASAQILERFNHNE
ncbi:MAG: TrmH family RNA methyltransferase [Butyricimonas faecalis]